MRADTRKPFSLAFTVDAAGAVACDILAARSGLSKLQVKLAAVELAFVCPLSGRPRHYRLPADRVVAST